jgi:hypothetical protein
MEINKSHLHWDTFRKISLNVFQVGISCAAGHMLQQDWLNARFYNTAIFGSREIRTQQNKNQKGQKKLAGNPVSVV